MNEQFQSIEHEVIFNKLVKGLQDDERFSILQNDDPLNSNQYSLEIDRLLDTLLKTRENHARRFLHSHRKVIGPFIVFGKKVIRKLLKWYIDPVMIQQTQFNNAATSTFGKLTELVYGQESKIENYQKKQDELITQISHNKEQYKDLVTQISLIEEQYNYNLKTLESKFEETIFSLENKITLQEEYFNRSSLIIDKMEKLDVFKGDTETFFEKNTYAQSGEDSIAAYILHVLGIPYEEIVYVDLGANHARELSNTYFFYSKGAKGVLVEANSALIPELQFYRHRDTILNKCVDVVTGNKIDFYVLNGDGLSTSDYEEAQRFCEINPSLEIIRKNVVETISYNRIVEDYLGKSPTILSIDIEGKDMDILQSIDFENHRPLIIITEMISYDIKLNYTTKNTEVSEFLKNRDYNEYAFTGINSIFLDARYERKTNNDEHSN
ncbi:methyltransferase, FkbM family [Paenibacillus sp. 1_12]|uniref:FkbM family methyltransferase n=1 Tax=Paenibacillus sp. 1_12 TaxID=1566278 RepID=UPI0008E6DB20|nr:FkbM family methyltransferase [Paenibacillus sp. 1_12]SFM12965.1 methyltransferase, FkbM family [Paenibacillus sp. 1_12]